MRTEKTQSDDNSFNSWLNFLINLSTKLTHSSILNTNAAVLKENHEKRTNSKSCNGLTIVYVWGTCFLPSLCSKSTKNHGQSFLINMCLLIFLTYIAYKKRCAISIGPKWCGVVVSKDVQYLQEEDKIDGWTFTGIRPSTRCDTLY